MPASYDPGCAPRRSRGNVPKGSRGGWPDENAYGPSTEGQVWGLTIKNDRTRELIRELARLTNENQTTAVEVAVEERLNRLRHVGLADQLLALGKDCAARLPDEIQMVEHGDLLHEDVEASP